MFRKLKLEAREALSRTGLGPIIRHVLPRYEYNFTPAQLHLLCDSLDQTRHLEGPVLEIGCASGQTTIYLNTHLKTTGALKPYVCIDTFCGFPQKYVDFEVRFRGKKAASYSTSWKYWSKELFERTMAYNGFDHVKVIQADIGEYDVMELARPSFCLIDVDLYQPVLSALRKVYERMTTGGIIVVDDCLPNNKYDGALQAYEEFTAERSLAKDLQAGKLGVLRVTHPAGPWAVKTTGT
jgi:SAM-dependent methyltransferase